MTTKKFFLFLALILASVLTVMTVAPDITRTAGICGLVAAGVLAVFGLRDPDSAKGSRSSRRTSVRS